LWIDGGDSFLDYYAPRNSRGGNFTARWKSSAKRLNLIEGLFKRVITKRVITKSDELKCLMY
jgi:hypothetical protein